ncbi:MAG: hypothetical protein CMG60_08370 [Candidatus Marinimicrobia bacterium]|nr:hypothetical protein [Candidatus Neomarinimicrobiota bacterium]|tara:strand:- start:916 stop:1146 length:231 start_codon:yes stop_codon:yes gene_type:complete
MDVVRLNIYERLRDFKVPSSVLDAIFSNETDVKVLEDAFNSLVKDGLREDDAAEKISEMIFKELNIDPIHLETDEK